MFPGAGDDVQIAILQTVFHAANHLRRADRLEFDDERLFAFQREFLQGAVDDIAELRKVLRHVRFGEVRTLVWWWRKKEICSLAVEIQRRDM